MRVLPEHGWCSPRDDIQFVDAALQEARAALEQARAALTIGQEQLDELRTRQRRPLARGSRLLGRPARRRD